MNYIRTNDKYNRGVALTEYKGEWKIADAYEADEGPRIKFGKALVGRDKREVTLPLAGNLGERQMAIEVLEQFVADLKEEPPF